MRRDGETLEVGGGFMAGCLCGWVGHEHDTRKAADDEGQEHAELLGHGH